MPLPAPTESTTRIDLAGRVIMVSGATGGLGRSIALGCAARGATLILHGRDVQKLEAIYDAIVGSGAPLPTILPLDFATAGSGDFDQVAGAIRAQLGRLDGLVHAAAFLGSLGPVAHQPFDMWQKVLRVNLAACVALTQAMLPLLSAAPDASITFTLDTRGDAPRAYWGAYAAAKAGLGAFATTLADECESRANLRINAVVPGPMRSPLRMCSHPGEDRSLLPDPESLAPLYLHLIGAQRKSDSGLRVDAQAWLSGQPATSPLVSSAAGARP